MIIAGIDPSINSTGCVKFELDDGLNIQSTKFLAFTQKKKDIADNILYFRKKDFKWFEQLEWMSEKILDFTKDCEYIACEDYAFGAIGMVFQIGEFCGNLKLNFYRTAKLRLYDPLSVKMFVKDGHAQKIHMEEEFYKRVESKNFSIGHLKSEDTPKSDIIDAFWIVELLRTELQLRKALISLKDLDERIIRIFNRVTTKRPVNILDQDFIQKDLK